MTAGRAAGNGVSRSVGMFTIGTAADSEQSSRRYRLSPFQPPQIRAPRGICPTPDWAVER